MENTIISELLKDDGIYPNNAKLPLLVYQQAIALPQHDPAIAFEKDFDKYQWSGSWRNGIYNFHHYHSTAHEVLGIFSGTAEVQLGGEQGRIFSVRPGDVIIIPAGVAHKNLGASSDFGVVGAYPRGQRPDMCYGKERERPHSDHNIINVELPVADPVFGEHGPLFEYWINSKKV